MVIFELNKFRFSVPSTEKFSLITEHQALRYEFQKNHLHGRLALLLDLLAEFEFEIEYRTGAVN